MIFPNGKMCVIIMIYGQVQMKMASAFLIASYADCRSRAREKWRETHTTMMIVDSKSIQNADTAEEKDYDAGKKHPG